jgi:hypothetical protein
MNLIASDMKSNGPIVYSLKLNVAFGLFLTSESFI